MERNYDIKTICAICNTPFNDEEEGFSGDLNNIPTKLCAACYEGFEDVLQESVPDVVVECPNCKHEINLKVETIDDP